MYPYFFNFFAGYFVGSIPTAYLLVKRAKGIDIRMAGSGNVGGFNTYDVTKSKHLGILVGVLDGLKGFVIPFVALYVFGTSFWVGAVGLLGATVGHIFPVWLRFKGGRGLATAAGGLFAIGVSYTIIWCTLWFLVHAKWKDILMANLTALLLTPFLVVSIPNKLVAAVIFANVDTTTYNVFGVILSSLLLISHLDVLRDLFKKIAFRKETMN